MPFKEPWRQYVSGDFFYGFSGARAKLITQLTNGRTTMDFAKSNTVAWLDQLLTGTALQSVPTLNNDFASFCRGNAKYKEVVKPDAAIEVPASDDDIENNRRWRRKSKAGIEFLTKHQHNIHFAIDNAIDWNAVISKPDAAEKTDVPFKPQGDGLYQYKAGDIKMRIITYAEIRFIYRNRTDADFQKRIQFWYSDGTKFSAGAPPWDRDSGTWSKYIPASSDND